MLTHLISLLLRSKQNDFSTSGLAQSERLTYIRRCKQSYFDLLFEASDRENIEQGKLSIYDKIVRDEIQIAAEREYAVREAHIEARAEALAEGRAEEKIETARKLKQAGVDIVIISQCTGLSVEEVQAL